VNRQLSGPQFLDRRNPTQFNMRKPKKKIGKKALDLTGWISGCLRVIRRTGKMIQNSYVWECLCDPELGGCGRKCEYSVSRLHSNPDSCNRRFHCGCQTNRGASLKQYWAEKYPGRELLRADVLEFMENGYSQKEIAKKLKTPLASLRKEAGEFNKLGWVRMIRYSNSHHMPYKETISSRASLARRADILEFAENGYSFKKIGAYYGISRERVGQIITTRPIDHSGKPWCTKPAKNRWVKRYEKRGRPKGTFKYDLSVLVYNGV
jgi:hypothetical protein